MADFISEHGLTKYALDTFFNRYKAWAGFFDIICMNIFFFIMALNVLVIYFYLFVEEQINVDDL